MRRPWIRLTTQGPESILNLFDDRVVLDAAGRGNDNSVRRVLFGNELDDVGAVERSNFFRRSDQRIAQSVVWPQVLLGQFQQNAVW